MTKEEMEKEVAEIVADCDRMARVVQNIRANARRIAASIAYEARKEAAV